MISSPSSIVQPVLRASDRQDMGRAIFYRKADFSFPSPRDRRDPSLLHVARRLVHDHFGQFPESIEVAKLSTFPHVLHVVLKERECFLKISKSEETRGTLCLEHFLYKEILKDLNTGLKVLAYDITCDHYPFSFLMLSSAPGACLRAIDIDSGYFPLLVRNLGVRVAELHAISMEDRGFGLIDTETLEKENVLKASCDSWKEHIFLNLSSHLSFAHDWQVIDSAEMGLIRSVFEECSNVFRERVRPSLLHGDLGSHNVFVDTASFAIKSIIDWEEALIGDPAYDIAMFASFYRMHEFMEPFLNGYAASRAIDNGNLFLKLWLYYLRIVLAKSVLRFRLGYDSPGNSKSSPKIKLAISNLKKLGVV